MDVDRALAQLRDVVREDSRVATLVPAVRASYREAYTTLHRDWLAQRATRRQVLGPDLDAINVVLAKFNIPAIKPAVSSDRRAR